MELRRDRQQLLRQLPVNLDCREHRRLDLLFHRLVEAVRRQKALENLPEDFGQRRVRRLRDAEHVEMAHEARRQLVPAAAGRRGRADQRCVLDFLPEKLLPVVKSAAVEVLAKQLDAGLRAVVF